MKKIFDFIKKEKLIIVGGLWLSLGMYRGIKKYNYENDKTNKDYMYTNSLMNGAIGVIVYANPFFLPLNLYNEIWRLEVHLRNLPKDSKTYYFLI